MKTHAQQAKLDYLLSFSSHICKIIKNLEKSQNIIFTENVLPYIIWCLSTIPLVWRYFGRVYALTKRQKAFLTIFCSFWSIYPPNKQKFAQNPTFWSTKTLFCVIYKTCSLWYVKITFWAQKRKEHKIKSKTFLRLLKLFQNVLRMFLKHKGKNYFWVKKIFFQNFFDLKKFEFYNTLPISSDVVIQGNFKRP